MKLVTWMKGVEGLSMGGLFSVNLFISPDFGGAAWATSATNMSVNKRTISLWDNDNKKFWTRIRKSPEMEKKTNDIDRRNKEKG